LLVAAWVWPHPAGAQGESAAAAKVDPTAAPAVAWMLDPVDVPDSQAKTAAEMKPYTEKIPGTSATFDMVPIPGGKFVMGSPESEPDREEAEGPQFEAEVEPLWMGKCEVTWDEYELWAMGLDKQFRTVTGAKSTKYDELADAVTMPTKPYSDMTFGMGKDGYPAICMTQLAAKMYCKWLSAKTGRYYRLPTEAEWEYACRAGTKTAYSFGDDPGMLDEYAWHYENCDDKYHKVGEKKPNPWGLYDMHGNVSEWVLDQYTPEGYQQFAGKLVKNPLVVPTKIYPRIVRGGSWFDDPEQLRSAYRLSSDPEWKQQDPQIPQSIWYHTDADFVGFRVVRPLRTPTVEEAVRYDVDQAQVVDMKEYNEAKGITQ
jgi:formylglycine-generating enzyme required for sulfatase activity